jgi:hypothetical protein
MTLPFRHAEGSTRTSALHRLEDRAAALPDTTGQAEE